MSRVPPPRFCAHSPKHGVFHKVGTGLLEPAPLSWSGQNYAGKRPAHSAGRWCQLDCGWKIQLPRSSSQTWSPRARIGFLSGSQAGLFVVGEHFVTSSCGEIFTVTRTLHYVGSSLRHHEGGSHVTLWGYANWILGGGSSVSIYPTHVKHGRRGSALVFTLVVKWGCSRVVSIIFLKAPKQERCLPLLGPGIAAGVSGVATPTKEVPWLKKPVGSGWICCPISGHP